MSSTKIVTGEVRFSYATLFEARSYERGQDAKFSVTLLIPKTDTETVAKIKAAIKQATEEGKSSKWNGKVPANLRHPLRDGDTEKDLETNPEYAGHWFVNTSSTQRPAVVDANLNPITDRASLVSGDYGRVSVNFYPYDKRGNRGVAAGLNNVQKTRDGEPLGGRSSATSDFDVWKSDNFATSTDEDEDLFG